jgi:regulatory protein
MSLRRGKREGMQTVTAIRAKGRSTDRLVVELDGARFVTLSVDFLARHPVRVGDLLDEARRSALAREGARQQAHDRAVRMLAAGGKSREGLRRRLREKGCDSADALEAVDRLAAQGLLDDAAFARSYVRSRGRALGRLRLQQDLARKGIARELAVTAIEAVRDEGLLDEEESIARLAERKARSLAGLDRPTRLRRLTGFLARRGFSGAQIRAALRRLDG